MWEQKSQHGVTSTERTPAKQDQEVGARAGEGFAGVGKGNTGTAESLGALCQMRWQQRTLAVPGDSALYPGLPPGRDLQCQGTACPAAAHGHVCLKYSTSQKEGRPCAESHYVKNHAGGQKWQEPPRAGVGLAHIWVFLSGPTLRWQLVLGRPCGGCVGTEYLGNERKQTPQGLRLSGGGEFSGSEVQGQRN